MLLFPFYPPDAYYPLRGYASSVCSLHIVRFTLTFYSFPLLLPILSSPSARDSLFGTLFSP